MYEVYIKQLSVSTKLIFRWLSLCHWTVRRLRLSP